MYLIQWMVFIAKMIFYFNQHRKLEQGSTNNPLNTVSVGMYSQGKYSNNI